MRIHSKFRDYYDGAFADVDPTFCYVRNAHDIVDESTVKEFGFPRHTIYLNEKGFERNLSFVYIFFCGTVYCVIGKADGNWYYGEEAKRILKENDKGIHKYSTYDFFKRTDKFLERQGENCHNINLRNNSPIIVRESGADLINNKWVNKSLRADCLLDFFCFAKAVDPFQARQSVEKYLRNDLAKQEDPEPLSDKSRIIAHGFDTKWSFRKDSPPTRKQK